LASDSQAIVVQQVDEAVNVYPCQRVFTAIGDSTDGFRDAMVACVETTLRCEIHQKAIVLRPSSGGKYQSVKIGPVVVSSADEVVAVYEKMKADGRMKWFI
jgi:putative lipoic acid-binding regulatory protein